MLALGALMCDCGQRGIAGDANMLDALDADLIDASDQQDAMDIDAIEAANEVDAADPADLDAFDADADDGPEDDALDGTDADALDAMDADAVDVTDAIDGMDVDTVEVADADAADDGSVTGLPWTRHFGGTMNDWPAGVAVDPAGNIVIQAGIQSSSIDFGTGPLTGGWGNVALAKFDPAGTTLWATRYDNGSAAMPYFVVADAGGNLFLGGALAGTAAFGGPPLVPPCASGAWLDVYLVKLDPGGSHLWSERFGDCNWQNVVDAASDGSNLVVTGGFESTLDFGTTLITSVGARDLFVAKLDAAGTVLWARGFGDAGEQFGYGIAVDPAGNVLVTGSFSGTIDFGGGPMVASVGADAFLVKLDSSGNYLWARQFGIDGGQVGGDVVVDVFGNVISTGVTNGRVDFGGGVLTPAGTNLYVAAYGADGTYRWGALFGTTWANPGRLFADPAGNTLITGSFLDSIDFGGGPLTTGPGGKMMFLAKLAPDGSSIWSEAYGDPTNPSGATGSAVVIDPSAMAVVYANFEGTATFGGVLGGATYTSVGDPLRPNTFDLLLGRFAP